MRGFKFALDVTVFFWFAVLFVAFLTGDFEPGPLLVGVLLLFAALDGLVGALKAWFSA